MRRMERWLSWVLRTGVLLAALLVSVGGLWYFMVDGQREILLDRALKGVDVHRGLSPTGLIHLGLLLLILTPVARVALALGLYLEERDWTFALITFWVLLVLLGSLLGYL
ncbi:DUF1634 domain-containing protein [Thermus sp. SYSU G05001]|uniref:DUF1634 domain-containing protein n=5 Tax=Thermaceae TaxID=188786 RepID=E8PQ88_THESS|nr:conserved hypothetical protein [Thermus scotoductus SA-01]MBW6395112.1 DUF1634 domain-containing protein [Thermus brevis]